MLLSGSMNVISCSLLTVFCLSSLRVESALIKTASVFNSQAQKRFYNPPQMTPYRCNMPWTDVIIAIADYLLCTISPFTYIMHRANDDYGTNDAELPPGMGNYIFIAVYLHTYIKLSICKELFMKHFD